MCYNSSVIFLLRVKGKVVARFDKTNFVRQVSCLACKIERRNVAGSRSFCHSGQNEAEALIPTRQRSSVG